MSGGRTHSESFYQGLKAAFRRLTKLVGGQEAATHITRIKAHATIGRYGRASDVEFPPLDVVADMEKDHGEEPVVLKFMLGELGYLIIPMQKAGEGRAWPMEFADMARELGEDLTKMSTAYGKDGKITAAEIIDLGLIEEITQTMDVEARVRAHLIHIRDGGEPHE